MDHFEDEDDYGKNVSCDTIRKKIKLFLATKEMTQTAFLTKIGGVNSNSFGRFMKLKGSYSGRDNGTYWGARQFFALRGKENKGAKVQKKLSQGEKTTAKKRPSSMDLSDEPSHSKTPKTSSVASVDPLTTVVELPNDLPVFDDCDEVRKKIAQCIHKEGLSQAGFAKAIGLTTGMILTFLVYFDFN